MRATKRRTPSQRARYWWTLIINDCSIRFRASFRSTSFILFLHHPLLIDPLLKKHFMAEEHFVHNSSDVVISLFPPDVVETVAPRIQNGDDVDFDTLDKLQARRAEATQQKCTQILNLLNGASSMIIKTAAGVAVVVVVGAAGLTAVAVTGLYFLRKFDPKSSNAVIRSVLPSSVKIRADDVNIPVRKIQFIEIGNYRYAAICTSVTSVGYQVPEQSLVSASRNADNILLMPDFSKRLNDSYTWLERGNSPDVNLCPNTSSSHGLHVISGPSVDSKGLKHCSLCGGWVGQ